MNKSECKLCGRMFWNPKDEEPHCETCLLARLSWLREPSQASLASVEVRRAKSKGVPIRTLVRDRDNGILDSDISVLDFIQGLYNFPNEFKF